MVVLRLPLLPSVRARYHRASALSFWNRRKRQANWIRPRQSNGRGTELGGTGWEYVHVCIDDASCIAFSQIKPDEKKQSAVEFLRAAVAYYAGLGIKVERVMTDCPKGTTRVNGSCYKAFDFRDACRQLGLRHVRTKPYTPKTNGCP